MTRYFKYICLLLATICILPSCKDDDKEEIIASDSVRITSFSLAADTTILDNLENVFFTIDLEKGLIYNADSLPKGTEVTKLKIELKTDDAAYANIKTVDSTYNYLTYSKNAIDFTNPVDVEVGSKSGLYKKKYKITVNVHQIESDRLFWGGMQYSYLPGKGAITKQHTVHFNGLIYCFMLRNGEYTLATAATPSEEWNITTISFPFTPDLLTMRCTDTAMYTLDTEGNMYSSVDGITWENTGAAYAAIIGNFGGTLLTLTQDGDTYYHDKYPRPEGFTPQPVASDFPVSGFSEMLTYNSPWLTAPQGMIVGGRTASGELTGAMWGYDGTTWAILNNSISKREGAAFFQYVTFFVDDNWVTSEKITWFVIGGLNETTALSDVWTSNNYGVTWQRAGSELQIPGYILGRGYASVIVCDEPIESSDDPTWRPLDTYPIPQGYRSEPMYSKVEERLVPYIYMFGGEGISGTTYDQVWRGIINRLRFEPIP